MNTPFTVSTQMKEQMRCLKRDVKVNNSVAVETPSRLGRPGRNGIVLVQPQCHILRQLVISGVVSRGRCNTGLQSIRKISKPPPVEHLFSGLSKVTMPDLCRSALDQP